MARARLTPPERRELDELLDKLGHVELAGSVARAISPVRIVGWVVERLMRGRPATKHDAAKA